MLGGLMLPATANATPVQAPAQIQTYAPSGVQVQSARRYHKAATYRTYNRTYAACDKEIFRAAKMIDSWKGYSVYYLTCTKVKKTWVGYVQYRYWSNYR